MERAFLEYGILGVSVLILGSVCYKFILVRMAKESDMMREQLQDIRSRYDVLLNQQLADYKEVVRTYTNTTTKVKRTLDTANQVMESVMEQLDDGAK
tara:strand:- start:19593 stop:19883 length:291 start_codon:yes stop_codon:yes gene_type:complete